MVQRFVLLLSLTWLFWLYLSSQLLPVSREAVLSQNNASSTAKSVNSGMDAITKLAQSVATSRRSLTVSPVPLNRLEISLGERKVTLYRQDLPPKSYRIAIGRSGWETPTGTFKIRQMKENPTWINPLTDAVISGGSPDNPLGDYWIGFWTDGHNWIGFHGTPNPESVGQAISHGCVRMYNKDIQDLFYQVSPGTAVIVKK